MSWGSNLWVDEDKTKHMAPKKRPASNCRRPSMKRPATRTEIGLGFLRVGLELNQQLQLLLNGSRKRHQVVTNRNSVYDLSSFEKDPA